ncbi:MAG: serine/threonine-protein phosphatase, partial [Ignavibacteriales bacterium]|nr:serine/threonine-protein phosphatase [Ignavibacteriales bacterium]
ITQSEIQLNRGDVAVFYTDGVTEARPKDGTEYGYEKLQEVVRSANHKSAIEIRDMIIVDVDKHMNHASPEDDLTIVVMKWKK